MSTYRALIALDAQCIPRVLATGSSLIVSEFEHYGTDAEEIGILSAKDIGPGLWLWDGKIVVTDQRGFEDLYPEWVADYQGQTRPVFDPTEIGALFGMSPPETGESE